MKQPTTINYHSASDAHGRCTFELQWEASYHPGHPDGEHRIGRRGQFFFADPRKHGHPRPEDVRSR